MGWVLYCYSLLGEYYSMKVPPLYSKDLDFPAHMKEVNTYFKTFVEGERVIETSQSGLFGRQGTTYFSLNDGSLCVRWDKLEGESGQMGTSITGGCRKISDCEAIGFKIK